MQLAYKKKAAMTKEAFDNIKQDSFNDELEKIAISWAGLGAARGSIAGALTGGVAGAVSNKDNRFKGALIGAGAGATVGAGGGAMIGKRYGTKVTKALRGDLAKKISTARLEMRSSNRSNVGGHYQKMKESINIIKKDPIGKKVYDINPTFARTVKTVSVPAIRKDYRRAGSEVILRSFKGPSSQLRAVRKGSLNPKDYRKVKGDIEKSNINKKVFKLHMDNVGGVAKHRRGDILDSFELSPTFKRLSDTDKTQWSSGEAAKKLRGMV